MQTNKSSRGFTTIEILVGVGLLTLLGAAAATIISQLSSQQSTLVSRDESSEFVSALNLWINTPEGCNAALSGKSLPVGGSAPLSINGYKGYGISPQLNAGNTAIQKNYRVTPKITVDSLILRDKGIPLTVVRVDGANLRRVVAQIEMGLLVGESDPQRKRFIEVPVLLNEGADTVLRCAGEATLTDVCAAVGSVLDPATGTCRPLINCTTQGTYMDLSCSPSGYGCYNASGRPLENPMTGAPSCPAGSVASQTGVFNYSHQVECGKKCTMTISDTLTFYICLRCN